MFAEVVAFYKVHIIYVETEGSHHGAVEITRVTEELEHRWETPANRNGGNDDMMMTVGV